MEENIKPKVAIDPEISEKIPTVAVSYNPANQTQQTSAKKRGKKRKSENTIIKRVSNLISDFLETIVVALSIFVVVYLFLVQPHEVNGSSMEPNFHNGEYILTDKISYRFKNPQRGDVIIFKAPPNPDIDYIKRVIGLPGESLKVENGDIYINGEKLDEEYLKSKTVLFPGSNIKEGETVFISKDEYFVMGDNRPHSSDSREFGVITKDLIIGRAFLKYWPPNSIGLVPKVNYYLRPISYK